MFSHGLKQSLWKGCSTPQRGCNSQVENCCPRCTPNLPGIKSQAIFYCLWGVNSTTFLPVLVLEVSWLQHILWVSPVIGREDSSTSQVLWRSSPLRFERRFCSCPSAFWGASRNPRNERGSGSEHSSLDLCKRKIPTRGFPNRSNADQFLVTFATLEQGILCRLGHFREFHPHQASPILFFLPFHWQK